MTRVGLCDGGVGHAGDRDDRDRDTDIEMSSCFSLFSFNISRDRDLPRYPCNPTSPGRGKVSSSPLGILVTKWGEGGGMEGGGIALFSPFSAWQSFR